MKVSQLANLINAKNLTPALQDKQVLCGYTCDLLSWVMSHGREQMAWVTVHSHMNVIAVAVLCKMSCVILPENIGIENEVLLKAQIEGIHVLSSPLSAYEISGRMQSAGITAPGQ